MSRTKATSGPAAMHRKKIIYALAGVLIVHIAAVFWTFAAFGMSFGHEANQAFPVALVIDFLVLCGDTILALFALLRTRQPFLRTAAGVLFAALLIFVVLAGLSRAKVIYRDSQTITAPITLSRSQLTADLKACRIASIDTQGAHITAYYPDIYTDAQGKRHLSPENIIAAADLALARRLAHNTQSVCPVYLYSGGESPEPL